MSVKCQLQMVMEFRKVKDHHSLGRWEILHEGDGRRQGSWWGRVLISGIKEHLYTCQSDQLLDRALYCSRNNATTAYTTLKLIITG